MADKKLQIRNSTAEFLIFTTQAGMDGIEVRLDEGTIWLSQLSFLKYQFLRSATT